MSEGLASGGETAIKSGVVPRHASGAGEMGLACPKSSMPALYLYISNQKEDPVPQRQPSHESTALKAASEGGDLQQVQQLSESSKVI